MKLIIAAALLVMLAGCVSSGLKDLTAAQLNALQGMALCEEFTTVYGKSVSRMVSVESIRKGATRTEDIVLGDGCGMTIKTNTGVAAGSAPQSIIVTPNAPTITVGPAVK